LKYIFKVYDIDNSQTLSVKLSSHILILDILRPTMPIQVGELAQMILEGGRQVTEDTADSGQLTLEKATELAISIVGGQEEELAIMGFMDLVVARKLPGTDNLFRIPNIVGSPVKLQVRDDAILLLADYGDAEVKAAVEIFFAHATYLPEATGSNPQNYFLDPVGFEGVVNDLGLVVKGQDASTPDTTAYFRAFDQDNSGMVHSREYLCAVATLDAPVSLGANLELTELRYNYVFRLYAGADALMGASELTAMVSEIHQREIGQVPSKKVLGSQVKSILGTDLNRRLTWEEFCTACFDGLAIGASNLFKFSGPSPIRARLKKRLQSLEGDGARPSVDTSALEGPASGLKRSKMTRPVAKWHRTMKIAIDRDAPLTGGGGGSLKSNLRLVRTMTVSKVVAQQQEEHDEGMSMSPSASQMRPVDMEQVHMRILKRLLRPHEWTPPHNRRFAETAGVTISDILELCAAAEEIFKKEPNIVQVEAPVRVFGDIHGQYSDLMQFFGRIGSPCDWLPMGDIGSNSYLFLGDFVDRGRHSLEVICVMLALKIKFPTRVWLLRGNHEDADINQRDGFMAECQERLGQQWELAWETFNNACNWMPLAADIEGGIFCCHGGIGTILDVSEIMALPRGTNALATKKECGNKLYDLLWSDPTESDYILGNPVNRHRASVFYGPDRVKQFLKQNQIGGPEGHGMLFRAHEVTMDGFDLHTGGRCVTVFSATNYCGCTQNSGAVLEVFWDLTPGAHQLLVQAKLIGFEVQSQQATAMAWHEVSEERPPTPPRRTVLGKKDNVGESHGSPSIGEKVEWDLNDLGWDVQPGPMGPPAPRPVTPIRASRSSADLSAHDQDENDDEM